MRRLTQSQEGVALPVATAMLLVISLFVVAFFSVTLQVNDSSQDDRSSKRALAAAEAGIQTALYRMNEIGTNQSTLCFTTDWIAETSPGQCPGAPGTVGNGASFTYYVTPELGATGVCLGGTGTATDRCITAEGTAGGVKRRVQVRANTITGAVSYKSIGLMTKTLMYAGVSSEITSEVGANGVVHFGNSAKTFSNASPEIDGAVLHAPGSTYETSGSSQQIAGGRQSVSTPYEFEDIKFEPIETTATNLQPGWTRPSGTSYPPLGGTPMHFRVTGTAYLPPGTYYFCRFSMANSAKLTFSTSEPTQIYVDSPSRSGSLCEGQLNLATTYPVGTFWLENSNEFNKDGREELVEVFVHGTSYNGTRSAPSFCTPAGDSPHTDKCESDVILVNSAAFEGMINAPNTTVELNNSGKMKGAIAADKIRFNNSVVFELTNAVKDSAPATVGGIDRGNWVECRPEATVSGDPESGC
jgi:Tfp pilus assembly protein PilX